MARNIGYQVLEIIVQHRKSLHHTYTIGPGKLEEVKQIVAERDVEAILFANRLPGAQVFKIQKVLGGTEVKVIDRNLLILEVFNKVAGENKDTGLGPFTTLTTYARKVELADKSNPYGAILIDSIGFIEDMHPIIVKAFNTTLGEISTADLALLFVDASENLESVHRKLSASSKVLKSIAPDLPLVLCINKTDRCTETQLAEAKKLISQEFPDAPKVVL